MAEVVDEPAGADEAAWDPPLRVRRAAALVVLATILQVTGLFLGWWVITYRDAASSQVYGSAGLFGAGGGIAGPATVWATTVLAIAPIPVLFIRVAAASWKHEPAIWRRDLAACLAIIFLGLAS